MFSPASLSNQTMKIAAALLPFAMLAEHAKAQTPAQQCRTFCQDVILNCGNTEGFKCVQGNCINFVCKDYTDPGLKDDCVEVCQILADLYCEPGDASDACPLGPDYSVGACIQDIGCQDCTLAGFL